MPDIRHVPPPRSHRLVIDAIRWADQQGIPVIANAGPGVRCDSTHDPVWERDLDHHPEGVSPIGAAILRASAAGNLPTADLNAACTLATASSIEWVGAFEVGLVGFAPMSAWAKAPNRLLLEQAYRFGAETRALLLTTVCREHNVRYAKGGACIACAADDPDRTVPTPAPELLRLLDEHTTPHDPDAGRGW